MNILFEVRHPAHVHHFNPLIKSAMSCGDQVLVMATEKEITTELLREYEIPFRLYGENKKGVFNKVVEILKQDVKMLRVLQKFKPDVVVGRPSHPLVFASWLLNIPSLIFAEDDVNTVFFNALVAHPFASVIVAPSSTNLWRFSNRKLSYHGSQKLAYIRPCEESAVRAVREKYGMLKPYIILRISSLSASHDRMALGFNEQIIDGLITRLEPKFEVYISSEKPLGERFKSRLIKVLNKDIHALMTGAQMFISDSQSMTIEAAYLGVPNIRFSSFVGKINAFKELEQTGISYGIHPDQGESELYRKVFTIISDLDRTDFKKRRDEVLETKTDITKMSVNLLSEIRLRENKKRYLIELRGNDQLHQKFRFTINDVDSRMPR
ncbi:MAG: DUF354 domain-containing protein [Cryomorphaceae bacterium]